MAAWNDSGIVTEEPYLAIYEFKDRQTCETWWFSPEVIAASEERQQTWAEKDFEVKWRVVYEPLKTLHR